MLKHMASKHKTKVAFEDVVDSEEEEFDEDEFDEDEFDEEIDLGGEDEDEDDEAEDFDFEAMDETLAAYLTTEDGDNVATALMSISDSMGNINKTLEMQNKILVKIFSQLAQPPKAD